GVKLLRFPKSICNTMGLKDAMYGRHVSLSTPGCEIRFVTDGDRAMISLTGILEDGYVEIYRGDFRYFDGAGNNYCFPVKKGQITQIALLKDQNFENRPAQLKRKKGGFSPDVWRIMLGTNFICALTDFEDYGYNVRPPRPDEVPEKTMLCYGTSLSYGACASCHSIAHIQLMGRLLNVNILNKAMGGSCMNEPEVADYFASDAVHFDAVLLENAINMGGPTEEYEKRTRYLLDQLAKSKPNVPVFFVTAYPHYGNVLSECACPVVKKTEDGTQPLDDAMRRIASSYPNAHVLEGAEMMNDLTALTCDGIHMSDYAHITTGVNLAKAIGERWLK
ncbi:MAG: SGNH/GDSL hydrolase family protein, partial [Clostridiales bacterium]